LGVPAGREWLDHVFSAGPQNHRPNPFELVPVVRLQSQTFVPQLHFHYIAVIGLPVEYIDNINCASMLSNTECSGNRISNAIVWPLEFHLKAQ
jgi:hypothetical protein